MLSLEQIVSQYPENLQPFRRRLLVEYLQYKILEILFNSEFAGNLSFLGGTMLRLVYGNNRFSEDLDFDNFGLTEDDFRKIATIIQNGLQNEGLACEIQVVSAGAYRVKVRLPGILYDTDLSAHPQEKSLIHIDSLAHKFKYEPDKKLLNKFDVFTEIFVTPLDIVLSQKIYAAINRRTAKGRDFFDIVFLSAMTKPNYAYLKDKINVSNEADLKARLESELKELDFKELGRDVQNFLFDPGDVARVELFPEFIRQVDYGTDK
jgi:predicted nucleotidyltransferase component of viral defense system